MDRRALPWSVALVTLITLLSSLGIAPVAPGSPPAHPGLGLPRGWTGPVAAPAPRGLVAPGPATVNPSGGTVAQDPVALRALASARADGVPARDVFVPRAGASPAQVAEARARGYVTPAYTLYSPAPIGLAYYGLSANPDGNGSVVATTLQTQSLRASVDTNSSGILPAYPFSSSPDAYGIQLNAVSTSINLFGTSSFEFWSQNVFEYYPALQLAYLVTNVWNFSAAGAGLTANAIYQHGPNGTVVPGQFYYAVLPLTGVTYPFNLSLWMNNSVVSGRNNISFTVGLTTHGVSSVLPYDWVIFNSTRAAPSYYTSNGTSYNPLGLTNDFELILGGPGGGSQADLFAANASLGLQYWNSTTRSFRAIPAAYSYGGETGETVTGAYVGWERNATTGAPYGLLREGPAMLQGLWNATGASGLTEVTIAVNPTNAFYFIAPNWTSNFTFAGSPYWAPQELDGGVFWLAPGNYNLTILLANYLGAQGSFVLGSLALTITDTMTPDTALGIYTPLWAWQNSQFASISTGGTGTPTDPYHIVRSQPYEMDSIFGLFNDFTFPVYSGVFFWGTSASVVMSGMPAMVTAMPYVGVSSNDLSYLLYHASNVALVNSSQISGWFSTAVDYSYASAFNAPYVGNLYATFSVELWAAVGTLIANDTFRTQSAGLVTAEGGNNTIWGNRFTMVAQPTGLPFPTLNLSLGLQVAEAGDLVYDNLFTTTNTAVNAPYDLYTGASAAWRNAWNITPTPAATVHHTFNFPGFPLTGTIIGNATQGGNYWWDYGSASNPLGRYPYDEYNSTLGTVQIVTGGDYYPLVYGYQVLFRESGLASGLSWAVTFNGVGKSLASDGGTDTLDFATQSNGTYTYSIANVAGWYQNSLASSGSEAVNGGPLVVSLAYLEYTYSIDFTETGLPAGTNWSVTLGPALEYTTNSVLTFTVPPGNYAYTIGDILGYSATASLSSPLTVASTSFGLTVTYTPVPTHPAGFGGLSTLDWLLIGVVLLVVIVAIAVAIARRRRGGSGPPPARGPVSPPPGATEYDGPTGASARP